MNTSRWQRSNKGRPCPVCRGEVGTDAMRFRKCLTSPDGELAICWYVQDGCLQLDNGKPWVVADNMGYMHRIAGERDRTKTSVRAAVKQARKTAADKLTFRQCETIQNQYVADIDPEHTAMLADNLGVSRESLMAYGIGWDKDWRVFTFPMFDGMERIVGFNFRRPDGAGGRAGCHPGSSLGLFMPVNFPGDPLDLHPLVLLLPEGVSDCAALATLGLESIGRPSNMAGIEALQQLLERRARAGTRYDLVVVGERDGWKGKPPNIHMPGIEGALLVARNVWTLGRPCRFLLPPKPINDIREWINKGATLSDILNATTNAPTVDAAWLEITQKKVEDARTQRNARLAATKAEANKQDRRAA